MGCSVMGLCVRVAKPVCDRAMCLCVCDRAECGTGPCVMQLHGCVTWLCVIGLRVCVCVCEVELYELRF